MTGRCVGCGELKRLSPIGEVVYHRVFWEGLSVICYGAGYLPERGTKRRSRRVRFVVPTQTIWVSLGKVDVWLTSACAG